jgi:hypothetical protein
MPVRGGGVGADSFVPNTFRSYFLIRWDIRLFELVLIGLAAQGR